eukprot:4326419-Karenia_brevis.AAC.1
MLSNRRTVDLCMQRHTLTSTDQINPKCLAKLRGWTPSCLSSCHPCCESLQIAAVAVSSR